MTIRVPPENIWDRILKKLGKERRVHLPENSAAVYQDLGPYVQIKGKRESFLKALFRRKEI
jgi:hypothetical protein